MARSFGKYRLLERLGGGGMAEVWRAEVDYTKDVSKTVALKMIREDLASVSQFHSLFIDEAKITSRISHTNVAQVFDFGSEDERLFLAMELVKGADLHSLMAAAGEQMRPIPLDVAAFIVSEVARGLDHAHRLVDDEGQPYGIVHRDVSPQNVLVSYAGEVKLTDFGIARARDKATHTETGTVMGKFRYMSPEQVRGTDLDARSDIFSCGILLYELVTGRQLFDGRTSAQVVDQIRYDELPDLAASRPDADPALDTVMHWALERDLDKRCPDGATLARDLERYVHVAHPQFTRDRVAEFIESLVPQRRMHPSAPAPPASTLAYAGTELAPASGPGAVANQPPMRSLADLEPEPDTTAPAKRGAAVARDRAAAPVATGPDRDSVPSAATGGLTEPPPPVGRDAPKPSRGETLSFARKASLSASQPLAPDSAPHDAPTRLLDKGPDATKRTRARPTPLGDPPDAEATSQTETRTAGRAHGETARRPASSRPGRAAGKRRRGAEATLGVALALLLLGVLALLLLRNDESSPDRKPGASTVSALGAAPRNDAGDGAAAAARTGDDAAPVDAATGRIAALDQAIAALKPETILAAKGSALPALLLRLDLRLTHATVDDQGQRQLGHACSPARPLAAPRTTADRLADLYAERAMLGQALPETLTAALGRLRLSEKPTAAELARYSGLVTLRVLLAPKSAAEQEALILARGRQRGWCKPLAGRDGRRFLYPHVIVDRDAVARLVQLAPDNPRGRLWRRYLEATPLGQAKRLGAVTLMVKSSRRQALKKDDHQVFHVTLTLKNADPHQAAKVQLPGFQLHGVGAKPIAVGLWKPDLREPLAAGKTVTLELTFATPLGATGETFVLSLPRAGAGFVWLQLSSQVLR